MATKKKAHKGNGKVLVPARLTESARTVWLAGVGALAMAESEGGKLVNQSGKLFGHLVKEGKAYEAKNRKRLETMLDNVKEARGDVTARIGRVTGRVTGRVSDRVVAPVNDAVAAALHRLGVPTRKEIAALTKRVEELTRAVERSGSKAAAAAE